MVRDRAGPEGKVDMPRDCQRPSLGGWRVGTSCKAGADGMLMSPQTHRLNDALTPIVPGGGALGR